MRPWYETAFGRDYLALYPHRDDEEAAADIAAILTLIDPPRNEPLLDLGCGAGRHLLALHNAGFRRLTGLDLSSDLLQVARRRLDAVGGEGVDLVCCDMRKIAQSERFATVLSLFTSFGYFASAEEDAEMLAAVFEAVRPGGTFLLDTLHRQSTIDHLRPCEQRTIGTLHVEIVRSITPDGLRVEKETRVSEAGKEGRVYRESVRMYSGDELRDLFAAAGFREIALHGSLAGAPFDDAARRTIAVGRKQE
ncbi:class I SAM-dependent methyltransferase [Candidatus Bipolaricaulota bacterium]